MPTFVIADVLDDLLHAGQDAAAAAHLVPAVITGEGQTALDHMVVGDRGAELIDRAGIHGQRKEAVWQFPGEDLRERLVGFDELVQIGRHAHRVEPQPKREGVFGLFIDELGQIHLIGESTLGGHRGHERLQVLGHRLLTGQELGSQHGGVLALLVSHRREVPGVLAQIDIGRVPVLGVALVEEPHREGLLAQPSGAQGGVAGPLAVFNGACHVPIIEPVSRTRA